MKLPGVVPAHNPGEDGQTCLGLGFPDTPIIQFTLHVGAHCQIQKTCPSGQIRHVGQPQLIDVAGYKLAIDQVWGRALALVALGRHAVAAPAADPAAVVLTY